MMSSASSPCMTAVEAQHRDAVAKPNSPSVNVAAATKLQPSGIASGASSNSSSLSDTINSLQSGVTAATQSPPLSTTSATGDSTTTSAGGQTLLLGVLPRARSFLGVFGRGFFAEPAMTNAEERDRYLMAFDRY